VGGFLFLDRMNFSWLQWVDLDIIWPILLIVGGVVLLFRKGRE